ncbi:septation protein SepH [Micrococcus luteus]
MAEMRPAGLTEDGAALRLTDQDGGEHTLPLTDEVRSLVAGGDQASETAAPGGSEPRTEDAASAPQVPSSGQGDDGQDVSASAVASASDPSAGGSGTAPGTTPSRPGPSTRPGADAADEVPAAQVSPREIQSRIRAGATAEQVAEATGASLARVRVFEYPVLAERAWIAQQVQQLEVWVGGPDLYSSTVEDGGPSTLGELVSHRLQELGLDADAVTWDAWREGPGPWTVVADFGLEGLRSAPTREQPPARFAFRQGAKHVDHVNRWAQLLADAQSWNIGGGRPGEDQAPFDVEAGDEAERPAAEPRALHPDTAPDPDEELLDILRARRGQRLGADEESDDALALMLTRDETPTPPARPTLAAADDTGAGSAPTADQTEYLWDDEDAAEDGPLASVHAFRTTGADTESREDREQDGADSAAHDAGGTHDDEEVDGAGRSGRSQPTAGRGTSRGRIDDVLIKDTSEPSADAQRKKPAARSKSSNRRASVPSWDEIVFGRKND